MSGKDKTTGMKSAYELALERMDAEGIERPKAGGLSEAIKGRIAEERATAEAKVAELKILHRDRLKAMFDPGEREQEEKDHRLERLRIEERLERKVAELRTQRG